MDKIDKTILWELCNNCRISYESLARKVNLSPNAAKNRVQNLIDSGVVHLFYVVLTAETIGAEFFQATVRTDGTERVNDFVNTMGTDPRVGHISILASVGGGAYLVWGQYSGTEDLRDLGRFLRSQKEVMDVEIYTIIKQQRYKAMDFTNLHLRVLSCLIDDPRMSITDLSDCSDYSPKSVRRALRELEESQSVRFGARPDLAAGGLVNINVEIRWDERENSAESIISWLQENYPISLWDTWLTAHQPMLYAEFAVDDLQEAKAIVLDIRESLQIKSTSTLVAYSSAKFPYLAEIRLKQMVASALE